jgi:hypothetical protein
LITPFLIDEIIIKRRVFDENGIPTDSITTGVKARVEDYNRMIRDKDGQEVMGDMLIITNPDSDIINEDFILIKKKNGIVYHLSNKEFAIKKLENVAGFFASHKEIYV